MTGKVNFVLLFSVTEISTSSLELTFEYLGAISTLSNSRHCSKL